MTSVVNFYPEPDVDCDALGDCDCCGKRSIVTKTEIFGITTRACDVCRDACHEDTRTATIVRFNADITVLREARDTARSLWVRSLLQDAIEEVQHKCDDIKEGFV